MRKYCALGVVSKHDEGVLTAYFADVEKDLQAAQGQQKDGGRAGTSLEYAGNILFKQMFFVASFPGIYEHVWKTMTEGSHALVLACACVFFQDTAGGVNGKHVEDTRGCRCDFCATCAPDQPRPQKGTTFVDWDGKEKEGSWDGTKPSWGCLWMLMWELNVAALLGCKQKAVVVLLGCRGREMQSTQHAGVHDIVAETTCRLPQASLRAELR